MNSQHSFSKILPYMLLILSLIVIYLIFCFVYPNIYARYLHPTTPPTNNGTEVIKGTSLDSEKILRVSVLGDSTALGQGTDNTLDSYSASFLKKNKLAEVGSIEYTNLAISGSGITEALENQLPSVESNNDLIFVSIGANNATSPMSEEEFQSKVELLVSKLKEKTTDIIWVGIPDFVTVPILFQPLKGYISQKAKSFNDIIKATAEKEGFLYIDVYDSTRDPFLKEPDKMFAVDKYHPSKNGYALWVEQIEKTLREREKPMK